MESLAYLLTCTAPRKKTAERMNPLTLLAATGIDGIDWKTIGLFVGPIAAYYAAARKADRDKGKDETEVRRDIKDTQNNGARMEKEMDKLRFENSILVGKLGEHAGYIQTAKEDHVRLMKLEEDIPKRFDELGKEFRAGIDRIGSEVRSDLKEVTKLMTRLEVQLGAAETRAATAETKAAAAEAKAITDKKLLSNG